MEIWHRLTFSKEDNIEKTIQDMGINYIKSPLLDRYLVTFVIPESDENWKIIQSLAQQKGALDIVDTTFTKEEILNAQWLRLIPVFELGYPQPKSWLRHKSNYVNQCRECGRFKQKEVFYLSKEPNLQKNAFMTLIWTYALFATTPVVNLLLAHGIKGFEVWKALIFKTKEPSTKTSQLYVLHTAFPSVIEDDNLIGVICKTCGTKKYSPHKKGMLRLHKEAIESEWDILQSWEWFGSGHSAYQEILVSNKFARLIIENGWQGVNLKVVEIV